jgi:hypothetical protein
MSDDTSIATSDDDLVEASTILKIAAPIITIGATWAVRKVLEKAYTSAIGGQPPRASDPDASMRRVILWAVATAAAVAVVNVAVDRLTAPKHVGG